MKQIGILGFVGLFSCVYLTLFFVLAGALSVTVPGFITYSTTIGNIVSYIVSFVSTYLSVVIIKKHVEIKGTFFALTCAMAFFWTIANISGVIVYSSLLHNYSAIYLFNAVRETAITIISNALFLYFALYINNIKTKTT